MEPEFFEVHKDLPREGPGLPADVHWVLGQIEAPARVLDAGCGPGADAETLAEALPGAQITAVDLHAPFAVQAAARCARFRGRVRAAHGDMFAQDAPFELIWSAGAAYFVGIPEALARWRGQLAPGGVVALSEPVRLPDFDRAAAFWGEEYPQITDEAGIRAQFEDAGFGVVGTRIILGAAWEAYYTPMQARIDALRGGDPSEALVRALDACQAEIDAWRAAPDQVAYLLVLARVA